MGLSNLKVIEFLDVILNLNKLLKEAQQCIILCIISPSKCSVQKKYTWKSWTQVNQ